MFTFRSSGIRNRDSHVRIIKVEKGFMILLWVDLAGSNCFDPSGSSSFT